jgi:hypothetical protein
MQQMGLQPDKQAALESKHNELEKQVIKYKV